MCGIVSVCALLGHSLEHGAKLEGQLHAALDRIQHRGPDGRGIWVEPEGGCALAHCRLSINDLSPAGAQPLHARDHDIHATVNGELYYDPSLRLSLEEEDGFRFTGHSDSELAIALYLRHGLAFLNYLRGEFVLCLWDGRSRTFLAARDRYGIKPAFWRVGDGGRRLEFSAEIKGFLGLGDWEPEWDVAALVSAGVLQDDRTSFKGVSKIRPGHYMLVKDGGLPEIRPYWDASYPDKNTPDPRPIPSLISELRDRLLDSVRHRLRADVPVGIYLSGGIDSSALAGMAAHLVRTEGVKMGSVGVGESICCFSIGWEGEEEKGGGVDESSIARRTAEFLGTRYIPLKLSEADLAASFEEATYHIEHHTHDLGFIGKYLLSTLPRKNGYKVVLTGEGADEHFGGYPLYLPDFMRAHDGQYVGSATGGGGSGAAADAHAHAGGDKLQLPSLWDAGLDEPQRRRRIKAQEEVVRESYRMIGSTPSHLSLPASAALGGLSVPSWMLAFHPPLSLFAPALRKRYASAPPAGSIESNFPPSVLRRIQDTWHPLHGAMYVWGKGHLSNQFLSCLGDRVEMAHSVEARTPFLDHELTEWVNGLAPGVKVGYFPDTEGTIVATATNGTAKNGTATNGTATNGTATTPTTTAPDGQAQPSVAHQNGASTEAEALPSGKFIEKWILREAMKPFITPEIYARRKFPYSAPSEYAYEGPMQRELERWTGPDKVGRLGFVDVGEFEAVRKVAFAQRAGAGGEEGEERKRARVWAWRMVGIVAGWCVLSERFGVNPASEA